MSSIHITLNNQKRFVFPAALAAVLLLLAGSAKAQYLTVRCVPTTNPNPSCAKYYSTISAAVGAAASGDIILVGPGIYPEYVTIGTGKDSLSIFGAQAGKDAREDRHDPAKESIVDASTTGGNPAFSVSVPYVVIDGFTIRGGGGEVPAGILIEISQGLQVFNNIIEDNGVGVALIDTEGDVVERNLIKDNNAESLGYGVAAFSLSGVAADLGINDNEFSGNHAAAIAIFDVQLATITNNTSENDGSFAVFFATQGGLFKHNRGRNFGAKGVLPVELNISADADAAVDIGWGNQALEISENDLEEGDGSISNGIAFTTAFGSSYETYTDSEDVLVKNNRIKGFKCNGIVAETDTTVDPTQGMTRYSSIVDNNIDDNGHDGVFIEGAGIYNTNISLFENQVEDSPVFDCQDTSTATTGYTLGTHDTWFNNIGATSYPPGLCTARGWQH
jgi:hypothetical protein